jgi:hypothetical protein
MLPLIIFLQFMTNSISQQKRLAQLPARSTTSLAVSLSRINFENYTQVICNSHSLLGPLNSEYINKQYYPSKFR